MIETRVSRYRLAQARYLLQQRSTGAVTLSDREWDLCYAVRAAGEAGGTLTASALPRLTRIMERHAPSQLRRDGRRRQPEVTP